MSTNFAIQSRYIAMICVTALVLSMLFTLTACSTLSSAREASQEKIPVTVAPIESTAGQATPFPNDAAQSPAGDQVMDDWEKAHAVYLRTLDYEQIDQQNNGSDKYLIKTNLIESRYHVKNSETAMYVEHDYQTALQELQLAKQRIVRAIQIANSDELQKLDDTKSNLDYLLTQAKSSVDHGVTYPKTYRYHRVETQIENSLASL
jgi:hypothetical protein